MDTIAFGGRQVGEGQPCFVIAEAGSNHNGSLDQALRLIDVAADAGADAIKFQLFRADRLYPRSAGVSGYLHSDKAIYDLIAEMEMPYDWLPVLAEASRARGLLFLASSFDEESADRLEPFVDVFKIASYEMTHLPLVDHVARKGRPVIISTGTAALAEVAETVDAFLATGNQTLALLQCTAAYPAPLEALNLRTIATMRQAFGVPVGLSDHSRDALVAPMAAVAAGASVLEKHFTLSRWLPGPDHGFAVEPSELKELVQRVRQVEAALGCRDKQPHPVEQELRMFARRSIFARHDISPGEVFAEENLAVLRCGKLPAGLPPKAYPGLLGRRASRAIRADTAIQSEDIQ